MALNFPNNPVGGVTHIDPSNGLEYVYNQTKNTWSMTGGDVNTAASIPIAPPGPQAPSNPIKGTLWFNTENGLLYTYYTDDNSAQWVNAHPTSN